MPQHMGACSHYKLGVYFLCHTLSSLIFLKYLLTTMLINLIQEFPFFGHRFFHNASAALNHHSSIWGVSVLGRPVGLSSCRS